MGNLENELRHDHPMVESLNEYEDRVRAGASQVPVFVPRADPFLALITANATNPDLARQFIEMRNAELARVARLEYDRAFAEMQPELPTIDQNGTILVFSKSVRDAAEKNGGQIPPGARPERATPYAKIEDIVEAVQPVLTRHGFFASSRPMTTAEGKILVRLTLGHKAGHREEFDSLPFQHDTSGGKSNAHAAQSAVSYARRQVYVLALNIVSRAKVDSHDDDAQSLGGGGDQSSDRVSEEQAATLKRELKVTASNIAIFLKHFKAASVEDMRAADYETALEMLGRKKKVNGNAKSS